MEFCAYIGIDWADKKHDFCLKVTGSEKLERGSLLQKPEAIDAWARALYKRFSGKKIAVCLEQSKGGLIFALMKYDFLVLYPVNPRTLARYREAFALSRAKDDPSDAQFLMELITTHIDKLRAWKPETKETRLLQRLTQERVKLINDMKRLGNRLTNLLKEYFPQALEIFPVIYRNVVADFILTYPTLEIAKKASEQELVNFFRKHTSGTAKTSLKRIGIIKNSIPLTTDDAIINASSLMAKATVQQIKTLNSVIDEFDKQIQELYANHPDMPIIDSLPGAGEVMGPRLIAALGTDRSKFDSAEELSCFTGIAPVVERSGNHSWTHWRFFCNKPLRQAFIDWTFLSIRHSIWAEAFYKQQRAKGKSHSIAIRALAFKWLRIIFKLWKSNLKYNESTYLKALQKSGSPIIKAIAA